MGIGLAAPEEKFLYSLRQATETGAKIEGLGKRYGQRYLLRDVEEALKQNRRFTLCISTGYFNISGWKELFSQSYMKRLPVQLLIGKLPSENPPEERDHFTEGDFFSGMLTHAELPIAQEFLEWLDQPHVEVRRADRDGPFLHAKTYMVCETLRGERNIAKAAIIGSGNLTGAGMRSQRANIEAAYFVSASNSTHSRTLKDIREWFEEEWTVGEDAKKRLQNGYRKMMILTPAKTLIPALAKQAVQLQQQMSEVPSPLWLDGLHLHQKSAAQQLVSMIEQYGGAILADDVGLGKTYVAGAVAKQYTALGQHVRVICPASLKPTWDEFAERERKKGFSAAITSFDTLDADLDDAPALIIVDEAHYLRNRETKRYRTVRGYARQNGSKLLLLTATPVNNSLADLHSMLSLFIKDGQFNHLGVASLHQLFVDLGSDSTSEREYSQLLKQLHQVLALLIIKRTRGFVRKEYKDKKLRFPARSVPLPLQYENSAEVSQFIHSVMKDVLQTQKLFAAYDSGYFFPKQADSESFMAEGLMRMLLVKRLESSLDAFRNTAKRFLDNTRYRIGELEGVARNKLAAEDMYKPKEDPEDEDDPDSVVTIAKLPLAELQKDPDFESRRARYLFHLRNAEKVFARWHAFANQDPSRQREDPKVEELVRVIESIEADAKTENQKKVIVFTSSKVTARYLKEALKKALVQVDGSQTTDRDTQLLRFAPETYVSRKGVKPPRDKWVNLLVTTDVLAEGVNLQQARNVIHYDLTWNPMRMLQRVGRVDRINSEHEVVYSYYMMPSARDIEPYLNMLPRLEGKVKIADDSVGAQQVIKEIFFSSGKPSDKIYDLHSMMEAQAEGTLDFSLLEEVENDFTAASQLFEVAQHANYDALPTSTGAAIGTNLSNPHYLFCASNNQRNVFLLDDGGGELREVEGMELARVLVALNQATPNAVATRMEDLSDIPWLLEEARQQAEAVLLQVSAVRVSTRSSSASKELTSIAKKVNDLNLNSIMEDIQRVTDVSDLKVISEILNKTDVDLVERKYLVAAFAFRWRHLKELPRPERQEVRVTSWVAYDPSLLQQPAAAV